MKSIIALTLLCLTGFANPTSEQIYIPPYIPFEMNTHPYLCCGVGSIMIGMQGGLLHHTGKHGIDVRLGAGTMLIGHGIGAHVNYLHFPELWGSRNYTPTRQKM